MSADPTIIDSLKYIGLLIFAEVIFAAAIWYALKKEPEVSRFNPPV